MDTGQSQPTPAPVKAKPARASGGRQRLLEAAERLFATRGYQSVSAAEIAREAGVAHGLLFHHFGSMEELYAEVSRAAASRMDETQLAAFKGSTPREQVAAFLRAHMRAVKQRQGDAVFRPRALGTAVASTVAEVWEESRQRAIEQLLQVLGVQAPTKKMRLCLRAWIGFHDQLVLGWLSDRSLTEREVLDWTLTQLDHLARDILGVQLDGGSR